MGKMENLMENLAYRVIDHPNPDKVDAFSTCFFPLVVWEIPEDCKKHDECAKEVLSDFSEIQVIFKDREQNLENLHDCPKYCSESNKEYCREHGYCNVISLQYTYHAVYLCMIGSFNEKWKNICHISNRFKNQ